MTLRVALVILIAVVASSCAPSVNVLPPPTPREQRISDLESAVSEMRDQEALRQARARAKASPPSEPAAPVDPARDAMARATYAPDPDVVGSVVAVVNGDIITREEVLRDIRPQLEAIERDEALTDMGREVKRRELIGAVLLLKVERQLALQEARRVIPAEEAERIEEGVNATISDLMRALGSMTRMEVMLRQQGHTVGSQKQVEIDNRRIRALLEREVDAHVDVTPGEIQTYYAEHRDEFAIPAQVQVREIFVSSAKAGSPEQAVEKAKLLRERVTHGEDFGKVARASSDGPNAATGGLWEWATAGVGTFRPEVEHAAFALRKSELSEVIVSEIGAHVLRAEDARPARTPGCAEAQGQILERLRRKQRDELYAKLIRKLWDKSTVDIRWQ